MFSALKKLTKHNDDRCPAPMPMSSSLQKKFSKGVHFNMKILIKGDRNVGKSCLLQRLQGGPFIEEYAPTDQIQVAPIHWTYKNTDFIVKVEVWEVVDKGRTKKKPPLGLKLENQAATQPADDGYETPVLDATFLDVYKNATGVILMLDITKPWTFEYVVKELSRAPADLPVVILGNHCDMQHHRQVHAHHIEQALNHARMTRTAPIRYAESSMRNGFGLRFLHKFFSVPFLRLQRTSLLEQLQRNQKDMEETEKELDDFQNSEESHYNLFLDRLASKRRQSTGAPAEQRANNERSPSIVLGAGKPIIPPGVNPLFTQSLNPKGIKAHHTAESQQIKQTQFVSSELLKPKNPVSIDMTPPSRQPQDSGQSTPTAPNTTASSGGLDEFYAGTLDSSFLEDLTPLSTSNQEITYETDSDDGKTTNPMVTFDEDDLEDSPAGGDSLSLTMQHSLETSRPKDDFSLPDQFTSRPKEDMSLRDQFTSPKENLSLRDQFTSRPKEDLSLQDQFSHVSINQDKSENTVSIARSGSILSSDSHSQMTLDNDFPLWAGDYSARRSPEGGEDPDNTKEADEKVKKHKKKKSKSKEKGDGSDATEQKEKKHKHKKSKEKRTKNPQQDLLEPGTGVGFNYEEYDSI